MLDSLLFCVHIVGGLDDFYNDQYDGSQVNRYWIGIFVMCLMTLIYTRSRR